MSVAWPDEDYVEDIPFSEERPETRDELGSSHCGAILAWTRSGEGYDHLPRRNVPSVSNIVWPSEPTSFEDSWHSAAHLSTRRLWTALAGLDEAIGQLDDEPTPVGVEVEIVAQRLQDLLARLARLEAALPTEGDLYEPEESKQHLVVDWRAINRDQAQGLPTGLLSEEGARLDDGRRLMVFDVSALEDENEESLVD